jgi:hypothetical protein
MTVHSIFVNGYSNTGISSPISIFYALAIRRINASRKIADHPLTHEFLNPASIDCDDTRIKVLATCAG